MVFRTGNRYQRLRKSGRVFAANASIGANGATIWRARLDRPLLNICWSVAGSNGPKSRAVRISELGRRELKERLGVVI